MLRIFFHLSLRSADNLWVLCLQEISADQRMKDWEKLLNAMIISDKCKCHKNSDEEYTLKLNWTLGTEPETCYTLNPTSEKKKKTFRIGVHHEQRKVWESGEARCNTPPPLHLELDACQTQQLDHQLMWSCWLMWGLVSGCLYPDYVASEVPPHRCASLAPRLLP